MFNHGVIPSCNQIFKSIAICLTFWLGTIISVEACTKMSARNARESSNMRMVAVTFATRYSMPNATYNPDRFQTIDDFLILMAKMDFIDSSAFFNQLELQEFEDSPPKTIGTSIRDPNGVNIDPKFLDFPFGYSIAIYPDLNGPTSKTPLLWTRGLHRFTEFREPYCGFVAYMDGHIQYYFGDSDYTDSELEDVFGRDGPISNALRILEHVPNTWQPQAPLPIRLDYPIKRSVMEQLKPFVFLLGPALIGGLMFGFTSSKEYIYQKVIRGAAVFTIIFFLTAMFVPCVCC